MVSQCAIDTRVHADLCPGGKKSEFRHLGKGDIHSHLDSVFRNERARSPVLLGILGSPAVDGHHNHQPQYSTAGLFHSPLDVALEVSPYALESPNLHLGIAHAGVIREHDGHMVQNNYSI